MCITVEDMDEAIHLWGDVLGFELLYRGIIPDPETLASNEHMADSMEDEDFYQSETVCMDSNNGAMVEFQRQIHPKQHVLPFREHGYGYTHIVELGLVVDDIDAWYKKIVDAGYTPQSEPWVSAPSGSRTFVFYDKEGNVIQLWQEANPPADGIYRWERMG
jgi:uncharacterized glyoxalase superfamily protein PhnB